MHHFLFCQTQEYHPRQLEHFFHTLQKKQGSIEVLLREKKGKVEWLTSEDWTPHFKGSRNLKVDSIDRSKASYWAHQKKGPLLPIKRWSQLEDRSNKTRINPLDSLIPELARTPNSFVLFSFKPIKERQREKVVKKVKAFHFEPDRHFDQWESKGWFTWSLRRCFGPLIRAQLHTPESPKKLQEEQTESLHEREDPRRAILDKVSRPLFIGSIQTSHPFAAFFHGFSLPYLGELTVSKKPKTMVVSAEEWASLLSPPTPNNVAGFLTMESAAYLPHPLENPWDLSEEDRKRHLYLLGKTGMGKSTALLTLFQKDLEENCATVLIDPHGDLIEDALELIPQERQKDILLVNPCDTEFPLALNPLEPSLSRSPALQASALVEMFQTLAVHSWGPRLEHILRNCLLTLIQSPNSTLLDLPRLLTDPDFCRTKIARLQDLELKRFFEDEYLNLDPRTRQEHCAPILNKVGPFLTSPLLRNIFGQPKSKLNVSTLLEEKKILLINLSKGKLGEDASRFLGMVLLSLFQNALLARANQGSSERNTVFISIDEFQNFSTPTLLSMLSELRKYGLALTLANQYLTQVPEEIQEAILGNIGSLLCFRTSQEDALRLAPLLGLSEMDLTQLDPFDAYSRFLRNQALEPVFRIHVEKPTTYGSTSKTALQKRSQELLARPRHQVEEKLKKRYTVGD